MGAIKVWQFSEDKILSDLSKRIVNRNLFKIVISKTPFAEEEVLQKQREISKVYGISLSAASYYVYSNKLSNNAYNQGKQNINMLMKSKEIIDLSLASDNLNISAFTTPVEKWFLCYPSLN
jgi:hypothetical protein